MSIVIVEDDPSELEFMKAHLSSEFPNVGLEVFETESDFISGMPTLKANLPHGIIIDMFLRWSHRLEEVFDLTRKVRGFLSAQ